MIKIKKLEVEQYLLYNQKGVYSIVTKSQMCFTCIYPTRQFTTKTKKKVLMIKTNNVERIIPLLGTTCLFFLIFLKKNKRGINKWASAIPFPGCWGSGQGYIQIISYKKTLLYDGYFNCAKKFFTISIDPWLEP